MKKVVNGVEVELTEEEILEFNQRKIEWDSKRQLIVTKLLKEAVKKHLDNEARNKDYDSILSACSYLNSKIKAWSDEAKNFIEWRDDVWAYALKVLDEVESGDREFPSESQLLSELPVIIWP